MKDMNIPMKDMNIPMNNMNMPMKDMNIPMKNMNIPMNNMNIPMNNMNIPMNNMNMPMNNMNMPMNNMNMPMNNNGPNTLPITFIASTGSIITMEIEKTKTIEDMLKEYVKKIDLPEDTIGEQIKFFYIDNQLDFKSKRKVESQFRNCPFISINVIDIGNIIPYWHITFDASPLNITKIEINKNKTIKDMMEAYANEIGFPKEAIGKEVIFMYEGVNLDTKENDIVENVLREEKIVNIFDKGNVINKLTNNNGFSTFNMMNPNINNDFIKSNSNSSIIKDPILRDPKPSIYDGGDIIDITNITFLESNGRKVNITMNSNKTLENLFKEYANKANLPVELLGKDFMFEYNGSTLDHKSQSIIGSMIRNTGVIIVRDCNNLNSQRTIRFIQEFTLKADQRRKIKYMMESYANKICVPKEDIGNKIVFLYKGNDLSTKQNDSIKSVLCDKATITVNHII